MATASSAAIRRRKNITLVTMPEAPVSPQFAQLFRDKVAEGDLGWIREQFQTGRLNFLRDLITSEERGQFAGRLSKGDMPWVRDVVSKIHAPGLGPLGVVPPPPLQDASQFAPPASILGAPTVSTVPSVPSVPTSTAAFSVPSVVPVLPVLEASVPASPPTIQQPIVHADPLRQAVDPAATSNVAVTGEAVTTVTRRRRPWLPVLLGLLLVAGGLYWLANRNSDDPVSAPTTVKAGGATSAGTTGATTTVSTTANATAATVPILDALTADGNHKTLLAALQTAGLTDTLKSGGPYTIFAPTDAAFAQLPPGTLDTLLANKDALSKVLLFHVASGTFGPGALKSGSLPSLEGDPLTIVVEGTNVIVNGVAATSGPQSGTVYSIDKVLLPANALPGTPGATSAPAPATTPAPAPAPTPATTKAPSATTVVAPVTTAPAPAPKPGAVTVFFNSGSTSLTAEANAVLLELAKKIRAAGPKTVVKITGYSDTQSAPDRIALYSRERAQRVADYLTSLGAQAEYKVVEGGALSGAAEQARRADIEVG